GAHNAGKRKFLDPFVKKSIKIGLAGGGKKSPAETDRGSVHEHEFAGHPHGPFFLEGAMNPKRLAPAVFGRLHAVRDGALAVVEQRPVDKPRPNVKDVDQLARKTSEPPCLVGMHHQSRVALEEAVVEVDHTADEFRVKDTDAAIVEQVDSVRRTALDKRGVITEMRIAVDDAETAERLPPRLEHPHCHAVAL